MGNDAGVGRQDVRQPGGHLSPPEICSCPLMKPDEVAAVTLAFEELTSDMLVKVLDEKGMAIITGVLDSNEVVEFESFLTEDLTELIDAEQMENAPDVARGAFRQATGQGVRGWPAVSLMQLGGMGGAFLQKHGLPHGRFAWNARLHPRVRRVYELIYDSTDLVVSCDNPFAANDAQEEQVDNGCWPHVDQNIHDPRYPLAEWKVYQGLLYVRSSESSHASTTVVWPSSHLDPYRACMADVEVKQYGAQGHHLTRMEIMQPGDARDGLIRGWAENARRVPMPAGGLLLWNSKTFHQSWIGGPRIAQPLCWEPRSRRDEAARERKLRLAALGLPSTHWASLGFPHTLSALKPPEGLGGGMTRYGIVLPLRPCIQNQTLVESADPEELWRRLGPLRWMEPLPAEAKRLLEASIDDKFQAVL